MPKNNNTNLRTLLKRKIVRALLNKSSLPQSRTKPLKTNKNEKTNKVGKEKNMSSFNKNVRFISGNETQRNLGLHIHKSLRPYCLLLLIGFLAYPAESARTHTLKTFLLACLSD